MNDVLDGVVGSVMSGFELAARSVRRVRFVVEAAVGERTAEALVKEREEKRDVNAFCWSGGRRSGGHRAAAVRAL